MYPPPLRFFLFSAFRIILTLQINCVAPSPSSPPGRVGLPSGQTGPQGSISLLPGGGARKEPQEEQAHPSQPKRYSC